MLYKILVLLLSIAIPALAQEEYTANANVLIFAEGLDEFPLIYIAIIIAAAVLIYAWKKK